MPVLVCPVEGKAAFEKSLKALQEAVVAAAPAGQTEKPVVDSSSLPDRNGRVYVNSDPTGAAVFVQTATGTYDTKQKTPATISVPKGNVAFLVRKEGYEDGKTTAVSGDAIEKAPVVKLEKPKVDVDILFEGNDGFAVYVDGKQANDKKGQPAVAPCTVALALGQQTITLAKEGFVDTVKSVKIERAMTVEVKGKPTVGKSKLAFSAGQVIELIIEARIDGETELYVKDSAILWKNLRVSKPGKHSGRNEPTYVNGKEWFPEWGKPQEERGLDTTKPFPIRVGKVDSLQVQVLAIGKSRHAKGIESRDPVTGRLEADIFVVTIPDTQADSRWYKIRIFSGRR